MWPPSPAVPALRCFASTKATTFLGDTLVLAVHQKPLVVNTAWTLGWLYWMWTGFPNALHVPVDDVTLTQRSFALTLPDV
jgi:predicted small integral membrane protein